MIKSKSLERMENEIYLKSVELDGYDVRGALILGTEKAVIFDTLSHPDDMIEYEKLIGDRKIIIIYSHADWDHIWGTAGVKGKIESIIAHKKCLSRFSTDVPDTLKEYQSNHPGVYDSVKLIPPNSVIDSENEIDLGGITVQLSHLPGHTEDSIVAYIPEKGILFAGDTVETPFPCLGETSPVANWIENLKKWVGKKGLKTVIPAHGNISGTEILTENIQYLESVLRGDALALPENMNHFYEETHRDNIRFAQKQNK